MFKSVLLTGIVGAFLLSGVARSADTAGATSLDLEPAINGAVSATGLFPSQVMEEEFMSYMHWVKAQGMSPLVAFESRIDGDASVTDVLPSQDMADQFTAYLRWVDEEGLSPFYAFMASDLD